MGYDNRPNDFTEKSLATLIQTSIRKNWNREAFTDYRGATLLYRDVALIIAKLHILFDETGRISNFRKPCR